MFMYNLIKKFIAVSALISLCSCAQYGGGLVRTYYDNRVENASPKYDFEELKDKFEKGDYSKWEYSVRYFQLRARDISYKKERKVYEYRDFTKRRNWKTVETIEGQWHPVPNTKIEIEMGQNMDAKLLNNGITDSNGIVGLKYRSGNPFIYFGSSKSNDYGINHPSNQTAQELAVNKNTDNMYFRIKYNNAKLRRGIYTKDIRERIKYVAKTIYNEEIKKITIVPTNIDSMYPFAGSDIFIIGNSPSPSKILSPYFKNKSHLSYAVSVFPNYVRTEAKDHGTGRFNVYPGNYKVKIRNPKYYYLEKNLSIKNSNNIDILMSELGTKHRVRIVNN